MIPSAKTLLKIDDRPTNWGKAWVHMQDPAGSPSRVYDAICPLTIAQEVFDPHFTRPSQINWEVHIRSHVDELGTFILEAYFKNLAKHSGEENLAGYEWVIATLESVMETETVIVLSGQAVAFDFRRLAS